MSNAAPRIVFSAIFIVTLCLAAHAVSLARQTAADQPSSRVGWAYPPTA